MSSQEEIVNLMLQLGELEWALPVRSVVWNMEQKVFHSEWIRNGRPVLI